MGHETGVGDSESHERNELAETTRLQKASVADDRRKLFADLFMAHRTRLRLMVQLRLDPRLQRRVDSSDVLQEAYLQASRRLDEYLENPKLPYFLWLRP